MRAALAALAITACALPAPVVSVRSARSGELEPAEPPDLVAVFAPVGCSETRGEPAAELYAPLVEHLRQHGYADYTLVLDGHVPLVDGQFMMIDPRSEIGALVLAQRRGTDERDGRAFFSERGYCVHVVREPGHITLVLVLAGDVIT